jgi:hypothetical protein
MRVAIPAVATSELRLAPSEIGERGTRTRYHNWSTATPDGRPLRIDVLALRRIVQRTDAIPTTWFVRPGSADSRMARANQVTLAPEETGRRRPTSQGLQQNDWIDTAGPSRWHV